MWRRSISNGTLLDKWTAGDDVFGSIMFPQCVHFSKHLRSATKLNQLTEWIKLKQLFKERFIVWTGCIGQAVQVDHEPLIHGSFHMSYHKPSLNFSYTMLMSTILVLCLVGKCCFSCTRLSWLTKWFFKFKALSWACQGMKVDAFRKRLNVRIRWHCRHRMNHTRSSAMPPSI